MRLKIVCSVALATLLFGVQTPAAKKDDKPAEAAKSEKAEGGKPAGEGEGEGAGKKKGEKSFAEVVEDFDKIEGLFTFYRDDKTGKVLMAIEPEQLDRTYMMSITRAAGDGYFFDSGAMLSDFPFSMKRVGSTVQFLHDNVYFRADEAAAIHRAIPRGLSDSLVGAAKIEGEPHPDSGAVLVDPTGVFVQDIAAVGYIFKEYIKPHAYSFDKANSYFETVRSFPENSEIDVVARFESSAPKNVPTLPDSRSFRHVYHFSLSELPQTSFEPRLADDRVGHFLTMHQDYTSLLEETPYVRYVNRWHLEKAEPKFDRSKPRQPIVYWLENTIPVEYRAAVEQGVLVWNDAFEKVGFKDAIVVKQMPDDADWDPADVRYNVVRWIVQPGGGYAVGPSRTNPFTGQIYDADIRISADMVRSVWAGYERLAQPVAMTIGDRIALDLGLMAGPADGLCDYQVGLRDQAAFGYSVIAARVGADQPVDAERYVNDFLIHVVAHEVGHTLGLRHNFKASTIHDNDALQTTTAAERGLTGSVMDYSPVNIAPDGVGQGEYWQTRLGPYDYWAIEYAYRPYDPDGGVSEKAMLDQIASKVADPMLAYATDEDTMGGGRGMDPSSNRWDLGDDPISYYTGRVAIARELWDKLEGKFEQPGERYNKLRQVFAQGVNQYFIAVLNVPKYVGGVYQYRDHVGDPGGRLPLQVVPAAEQREALRFLTEEIFSTTAFEFPPTLFEKLAPERFWDFAGSLFEQQRLDYPVHDVVAAIQGVPLDHLYNGLVMSRIVDSELRASNGEDPLTLAEMFDEVRRAIWSELGDASDVDSFRRSLQRAHLQKLIALVVNPPNGTPEDATTLARADLRALTASIGRSLNNTDLDPTTRAHLDETAARIDAALAASIERQLKM
ncbi:MAG TPA: zinc-dependent metalloprotease [Candidatus Polarisedimenticolaceae bacterium]|nr:zinc-dependent metalloprotease [Candidatus Polarisedimenticolaceae bacterium]